MKRTADAIFDGSPSFPWGIPGSTCSFRYVSGTALIIPMPKYPRARAFAVIPFFAFSTAITFAIEHRAVFVVEYATVPGTAIRPTTDETRMMRPKPILRMRGRNPRLTSMAPVKFTAIVLSQSLSLNLCVRLLGDMPGV